MKKLLLLVLTMTTLGAKAQISLEHTYIKGGTWNICMGNVGQLMVVDFEVSGERYVNINRCDGKIEIHDLGHTLLQTISLANIPTSSTGVYGTFLYFSEHLFDTDDGIEYMYVMTDAAMVTYIFDEDGTQLFMQPAAPMIISNIHLQQYPIYNTSAGTKMILTFPNGDAKVFGLPGHLSTTIQEAGAGQLAELNALSAPYPNPARTAFNIDYHLPPGTNNATIIFTDLYGREVKRMAADKMSGTVSVSTSQLSPGTYYYYLSTPSGNSSSNKVLVIK